MFFHLNVCDVYYQRQLTEQHLTYVSIDSELYITNNILLDQ